MNIMNEFTSEWMKKIKPPTIELTKPPKHENNTFVSFGGTSIGHPKNLFSHKQDENDSKDQKAHDIGFNTIQSGQMYMKQITDSVIIFIVQNDSGKYDCWRETWTRSEQKSTSHKDITKQATFNYALLKAKEYIGYFTKEGAN
jgi:hypothetical protein